MIRTATLAAVAVFGIAGAAQSAPVIPAFTSFGSLPQATFGGSGIPNDAVAITTFSSGGNDFTLGMSASQRFLNPVVTNDGAGTFGSVAGANFGDPTFATSPSATSGAAWNFNFFIDIVGTATIGDFDVVLLYDFDAAAGTDESQHGVLDFNALGAGALSTSQGSQNLLFGFLAVAIPGITPPPGVFDPNAGGEYTFSLRVSESGGGALLGESAIAVDVAAVPEPSSLPLFASLLVIGGLARARRNRRR